MAFTFACGDVIPGCAATFVAPTEGALLSDVAVHAGRDHGVTELTPELVEAVESRMHETPKA